MDAPKEYYTTFEKASEFLVGTGVPADLAPDNNFKVDTTVPEKDSSMGKTSCYSYLESKACTEGPEKTEKFPNDHPDSVTLNTFPGDAVAPDLLHIVTKGTKVSAIRCTYNHPPAKVSDMARDGGPAVPTIL